MVANVKITMRGKDRLIQKLESMVDGLGPQLNKDLEKGSRELERVVKSAAPIETGDYKESINVRPIRRFEQGGRQFSGVRAWGLFARFEWKYLEFGTVKMLSRPHIMGPFRLLKKRIKSRISRGMNKVIKEHIKRNGGAK